jgi:hypothetical protein
MIEQNTNSETTNNSENFEIKNDQIFPDQFRINFLQRFQMYREMKEIEPRMWTREHHLMKMLSISFGINFTIYGIYKSYYSFYNPSIGFMDSFLNSHKMKFILFSVVTVDFLIFYFNSNYIHQMIYRDYYSTISNKDFYQMYEGMKTKSTMGKKD